jgi:hypothetical protein
MQNKMTSLVVRSKAIRKLKMESGMSKSKGDNKKHTMGLERDYNQYCPFLIEAWSRLQGAMDKGQ